MATKEEFQAATEATTTSLGLLQTACYQQGSIHPDFPTSAYLRLIGELEARAQGVCLEVSSWEASGFSSYPGLIEDKIKRLEAVRELAEKHLAEITMVVA